MLYEIGGAWLYVLFTIVESITFVGFLYLLIENRKVKNICFLTGILLVLFNIFYPFFTNNVKQIDSVPIGIETIIILVLSFYYLYEKTNDTSTLYIYSTYPFWVVIGVVLYLSGSFFIYIFADSLTQDELQTYWKVTNISSIVRNLFIAIAIIVNSKPHTKILPTSFGFSSLN